MSHLVSVIMTCYNSEKYISKAIESVLVQTYEKFELIIVNDGSTDNTENVIKSFDDIRIRYFFISNIGQSGASNYGLGKAKGDYIKFFDSDDIMNEEHLDSQLNLFKGNNQIIVSCSWGRFYDENPLSAKFLPETVWMDMNSIDWLKESLTQKNDMMAAWLWMIPRQIIDISGGWNENLTLNNDFEFSVRLLSNVKQIKFSSKAKIYYRSGNISLSQIPSVESFKLAILATDLGCEQLLKLEDSIFMKRLCADRYQEWLFRVYPLSKKLEKYLQDQISFYGGSLRKMDGGILFKSLATLIGWRLAKQFKIFLARYGYKKLPF